MGFDMTSRARQDGEHVAAEETERTVIARSALARMRAEVAGLPEEQRISIMLICVDDLELPGGCSRVGHPDKHPYEQSLPKRMAPPNASGCRPRAVVPPIKPLLAFNNPLPVTTLTMDLPFEFCQLKAQ